MRWPGIRRALVLTLAAILALAAPAREAAAQAATPVLVVNQERILREARVPRQLAELEQLRLRELQADISDQQADLRAEEIELAGLRGDLPVDEFQARALDFDRRMRAARRAAQERLAGLQARFRHAREQVVRYLPQILARVAEQHGAYLVLDSAQILIASPAIDVTEEVIAALDAATAEVDIESLLPPLDAVPSLGPDLTPGLSPGVPPEPLPRPSETD